MSILKLILEIIGGLFFKWLGQEKKQSIESENEALKGRADSVNESFDQQEAARKASEEARKEVEGQGSGDDVFGSKEWNGDNNE